MHKLLIIYTFPGLLLITTPALGQYQDAGDDFLNIEFEFGLGYSRSSNTNFFNDLQGVNTGGGFGLNMGFRYHFNYEWSAGLHFLLSADEIKNYDPDLVLGYFSESPLSTSNINIGFNGKYTKNLNRWQPFASGGLGLVLGALTTLEYEEQVNEFLGIGLDLGMGIGYMVANNVMISCSVLRNYGVAWWTRRPSELAINNQFDPGFWSLTLNVSVFLPETFD